MANIYHITSVHQRYDTRIFKKECTSLAEKGHNVNLIVCDGLGNEIKNNVNIIDTGVSNKIGRIKRFLFLPKQIYKVLQSKKDIDFIHFHDPELIFIAKKFVKKGIKVIYDSHENLPKQVLSKPYIPTFARKIISSVVNFIELKAAKKFYAVVTVTDEIKNRFLKVNKNVYLLRNFSIVKSFGNVNFLEKKMKFVYSGGITKIRGALEMAHSSNITSTEILFFGPIEDSIKDILKDFNNIKLMGSIDQDDLFQELKNSTVGLILFHKVPNHMVSSPNKMFEYMAAGMAIIASDIPMWKEVIDTYKCGICVDPYNIDEISKAIMYMKNHPDEVFQMGKNGREAVINHFSWENEQNTLFLVYEEKI